MKYLLIVIPLLGCIRFNLHSSRSISLPSIYFITNSTDYYSDTAFYYYHEQLKSSDDILKYIADLTTRDGKIKLDIIGQCDITEDTNVSYRRARKVFLDLLDLGVDSNKLRITSNYFTTPKVDVYSIINCDTLCQNYAKQRNRCVDFLIIN
jgi:hypothetical protein